MVCIIENDTGKAFIAGPKILSYVINSVHRKKYIKLWIYFNVGKKTSTLFKIKNMHKDWETILLNQKLTSKLKQRLLDNK